MKYKFSCIRINETKYDAIFATRVGGVGAVATPLTSNVSEIFSFFYDFSVMIKSFYF